MRGCECKYECVREHVFDVSCAPPWPPAAAVSGARPARAQAHAHTHALTDTYTHARTHTHTHSHTHTRARARAHAHTHAHTHTHTHTGVAAGLLGDRGAPAAVKARLGPPAAVGDADAGGSVRGGCFPITVAALAGAAGGMVGGDAGEWRGAERAGSAAGGGCNGEGDWPFICINTYVL